MWEAQENTKNKILLKCYQNFRERCTHLPEEREICNIKKMIGYPPTRANSKNRYFLDSLLKLAFCHWISRSQKILGRVPEKNSGRCGWVYHDVFDEPMPKNRCAKRFWPNGPSTAGCIILVRVVILLYTSIIIAPLGAFRWSWPPSWDTDFGLSEKTIIQWLFEPRSQTVADTGSFWKFGGGWTFGSSFDYRGRYPRTSPSWWSADATPGVTDTVLEC